MTPTMIQARPNRIHGGTDALGLPAFDFSTNSNAVGPCPMVQSAIAHADATRYPDPNYTVLRGKLAGFHGVEASRIVIAGSASEFIFRITALVKLQGVSSVFVPSHGFSDYTHAAQAWNLPLTADAETAGLIWHCEPSSPLGQVHADAVEISSKAIHVLDLAYAPLQLSGGAAVDSRLRGNDGANTCGNGGFHDAVWQIYSPNKALGLTGVRAAYAIAPLGSEQMVNQLNGLSASWPLGAHGVALLESWVSADAQTWLADSLLTLRVWKIRQTALLESLGWTCQPSVTNFFCATPKLTDGLTLKRALTALRNHSIKLRDTTSFGLSGQVRLSVQPPAAQDVLREAWLNIIKNTTKDMA